jgi:hypothetical protein
MGRIGKEGNSVRLAFLPRIFDSTKILGLNSMSHVTAIKLILITSLLSGDSISKKWPSMEKLPNYTEVLTAHIYHYSYSGIEASR